VACLIFQTIAQWGILFFSAGAEIALGRWFRPARKSSQFTSGRAGPEPGDSEDGAGDAGQEPAATHPPQADQCADEAPSTKSIKPGTGESDGPDQTKAGIDVPQEKECEID
tara:strand:- start:1471 stop:1803 length:333 start_codon:yes stop_codon:yes gene_type:complete